MSTTESKSQITHYLPRWLLKKFRQPTLYELDIFTGEVERRSVENAGSDLDLWPDDIERGLGPHDNQASRIYRKQIEGRQRIVLTDSERKDFALWLAHFYVRVPATREKIRHHLDEQKENPEPAVIRSVWRIRTEILEMFQSENPQLYDEMVKNVGKAETEEYVLGMVAQQNVTSKTIWAGHEERHHYYMRNNQSENFARRLCEYDWMWLNSEYGFVIGDNPLVAWHNESQRFDVGIGEIGVEKSGVEITMPLGLNLLLHLDQLHSQHDSQLMECNEQQTRVYNERQRFAASKHVYGNSPGLLDFITKPIISLRSIADGSM